MKWGVFDSGVGGLTVVHALKELLPDDPLDYLGDTARVPYGIRSVETVRRYAHEAAEFLAGRGADGLIVACNTASALALDVFRDLFPGPVLGVVEPGVQEALAATASGRIGVIGTPATIRSDAYGRRLRELRPGIEVHSAACPLFVPLAEEGWTDGEIPALVAERYRAAAAHEGKPLAAPAGRGAAKGGGLLRPGRDRIFVTDPGGSFRGVADRFLGAPLPEPEVAILGPQA
ncbi:MAG: murI [Acidobacteria bacterium]|nr:murI [Acidobacteriota bacterium]